ncbi:MAG: tRNA (adenosine(37)-N6)-dimethylallyltransferase MiaA [Hydrogenoanaerobacterium sp.]
MAEYEGEKMDEQLKKTPLVCVVGPTASGKSSLAVKLAQKLSGEIISADSMQIYEYMNIGTAKPTAAEMCGIPHHLIDFIPPDKLFTVADYVKLARQKINEVTKQNKLPILTGGTGLYISSVADNIIFSESPSNTKLRAELKAISDEQGNEFMWNMLNEIDPILAKTLHPNNSGRVLRGIEIYKLTGTTMTEHKRLSRLRESPYKLCMLGLNFKNRETLYARIDARVDAMISLGLVDEVRELIKMGYSKTSVQAIGYKEFFDYLNGKCSLQEAVDCVKQETRKYAKRQLTWFRRDERINWIYADEFEDNDLILQKALKLINKNIGGI